MSDVRKNSTLFDQNRQPQSFEKSNQVSVSLPAQWNLFSAFIPPGFSPSASVSLLIKCASYLRFDHAFYPVKYDLSLLWRNLLPL